MKPPYEITQNILSLYGEINEALGIAKGLMLVKPEARLRKENRIKTIHSSLAIEGNTLNIEHVTAIINNKRIIGPEKDIIAVKNAIEAYDSLSTLKPYSLKDFLKAHKLLMNGLVEHPGKLRTSQVGVMKGKEVAHIAPPYKMVPSLMDDLFTYIKKDTDLDIIKTCVFHYEVEFIHPFEDGNGRTGRYWQTRLLMNINPIFEYIPIEKVIKDNQEKYYTALSLSDTTGSSTAFIEFMLDVINESLRDTIEETKGQNNNYSKRIEFALGQLNGWFDRKNYMEICKDISSATASRDIKQLLEDGKIESTGSGRMMRYRKTND